MPQRHRIVKKIRLSEFGDRIDGRLLPTVGPWKAILQCPVDGYTESYCTSIPIDADRNRGRHETFSTGTQDERRRYIATHGWRS